MAKNTIYDYSTSAVSNTDIAGIGIQGTNFVSNFDDAFRTIMAQIAVDVSPRRMSVQGALYGLTLSNNAGDAVNDIDIAVGMATTDSTTDPRTMVLSSILTKRLDANWAVGTNQGGLDTGSIANTTYHIWLIQRSDTGVVDALFSTSATAPTMPTNYDRKRRIGSIMRASATIRPFIQDGDYFQHLVPVADVNAANPGTSAVLRTLSVPLGIRVKAYMNFNLNDNVNGLIVGLLTDPSITDSTPTTSLKTLVYSTLTTGFVSFDTMVSVVTNTSAQIRSRVSFSDANLSFAITTFAWTDTRGRV